MPGLPGSPRSSETAAVNASAPFSNGRSEGMQIICARRPEEALADGEAWNAERSALLSLGFEIIEMQNAIIIFGQK
jgi:hypothetical protein